MSGEADINRQVTLLVIGAIVGCLPSLFLSAFQYRQQQHQFLLERGFTAMKDFSTALDATDVLEKLDDEDFALYGLSLRPGSSKALEDAYESMRNAKIAFDHYFENVRTASVPMNIVFHTQMPVLKLKYAPHLQELNKPRLSDKEIINVCDLGLKVDEELRSEIAGSASTYEDTVEKLASEMR